MKTVIEMAREAKLRVGPAGMGQTVWGSDEELERFAELVRADEREKCKWDVHSCGPTCTKVACVAVREAVEAEREQIIAKNAPEIERMNAYIKTLEDAVVAEREACAKVCEDIYMRGYGNCGDAYDAIRARTTP